MRTPLLMMLMPARLLQKKWPLLFLLALIGLLLCVQAVKAADSSPASTESTQLTTDNPEHPSASPAVKMPETESAVATEAAEADQQILNTGVNIEIIQQTLESLRLEIENSRESTDLNKDKVQSMKDGLNLIEEKLTDAYAALDQSRTGISSNAEKLLALEKQLLTSSRDVRTNSADLTSQKSLIEDNSVRLYELLIQLDKINTEIGKFSVNLNSSSGSHSANNDIKLAINSDLQKIWMLLVTGLVFLVPLAFSFPWHDNQQTQQTTHTAHTTDHTQHSVILASLFAMLGYCLIGFSLMYGTSSSGWVGLESYWLPGATNGAEPVEGAEPAFDSGQFFLFQAGFIMLAALIIVSAIAGQVSARLQATIGFFTGALLIPVYGHWVWASRFTPGNKGWLEVAGFVDQAGAVVISVVAACFALVMIYKLNQRSHMSSHDSSHSADEPAKNLLPRQPSVYSGAAVIFLWLSWLGFSSGFLPLSDQRITLTLLNTLMAAIAGAVTAFTPYAFFGQEKISVTKGLAGFVSGLVAISACGQNVTLLEAILVGVGAGIFQNLFFNGLRKLFMPHDHQIRAAYLITIHGVAGIWGTLCVALVGSEGNFAPPNFIQLVTQIQGLAAAIAYSIVMAYIAIFLMTSRKKPPRNAKAL